MTSIQVKESATKFVQLKADDEAALVHIKQADATFKECLIQIRSFKEIKDNDYERVIEALESGEVLRSGKKVTVTKELRSRIFKAFDVVLQERKANAIPAPNQNPRQVIFAKHSKPVVPAAPQTSTKGGISNPVIKPTTPVTQAEVQSALRLSKIETKHGTEGMKANAEEDVVREFKKTMLSARRLSSDVISWVRFSVLFSRAQEEAQLEEQAAQTSQRRSAVA